MGATRGWDGAGGAHLVRRSASRMAASRADALAAAAPRSASLAEDVRSGGRIRGCG